MGDAAASPYQVSVGQSCCFAHSCKFRYPHVQTELSPKQRDALLAALQARFEANKDRDQGLAWAKVQARLEARLDKLWSLHEMERAGGEPDVGDHS